MPPKKKEKRVFQYKGAVGVFGICFSFCFFSFCQSGTEGDEIAEKSRAPKKGERKKIARVGTTDRDQAPAASRDGMTISERRLAESMKTNKKRDRSESSADRRPEPAAVKR
jgi:hypothetical protein